jgi:hypothetical protein
VAEFKSKAPIPGCIPMSEHVIALDPGGRSGWASARMSEDRLELTGSGVLPQLNMGFWLAERQGLWSPRLSVDPDASSRPSFDVVVCETWRPFRKNGSMDWIEGDLLIYAQHVGALTFITRYSGASYVEQKPSDKKRFLTSYPQALQDLDAQSDEQHDQDARYHLWGYFFENWFTMTKQPDSCVVLP